MASVRVIVGGGLDVRYYDNLSLDIAIRAGGTPLRDDGTPYEVIAFGGGFLLDGCPLNRVLYGLYTAGQKEALDAVGLVCFLDAPPVPVVLPPPAPSTAASGTLVPVPWSEPIVAVVTGEPVSTTVLTVAATIVAALFGIFHRNVPAEVATELHSLRDGMIQLGQELIRIGQLLAAAIQAALGALRTVYEKVIKKALDRIEEINSKIGKILDKILKPYLDFLQRIRQIILDIYGRIFLPIIDAIQTIRKAIALLKILHVPGMAKLDAKLQKIQGKLIGVITDLLRRTNDHSGLLNILLTLRGTLQHGVLLGSLHEVRRSWINSWWNEQTAGLTIDQQNAITFLKSPSIGNSAEERLDYFIRTGHELPGRIPGPQEKQLNEFLNGRIV